MFYFFLTREREIDNKRECERDGVIEKGREREEEIDRWRKGKREK